MELEKESRKKSEAGLTEDKNNKLDHLTKIIGPFGPFHAIIYTAIGLSIVIHGWQMFSNKFYTYKTNFWCAKPNSLENLSINDWLNLSAPLKYVNNAEGISQCEKFNVTYSNISKRPDENTKVTQCTAWEYDTKPFDVSTYQE